MRKLQIKFPNQIRISGWDFGSSARAMNQAGGKDSLMTYECEFPQADLRTVRKSTTERKSMSTKTSIKRIALVAVSALGLGLVVSVSPARAEASNTELPAGSVTLAAASGRVGTAVQSAITLDPDNTDGIDNSEAVIMRAIWVSRPAGSTASLAFTLTNAESNYDALTFTAAGAAGNELYPAKGAYTAASGGAHTAAKRMGSVGFNPDVAGTYILRVWHDTDGLGTVSTGEAVATDLTVLVSAAPTTITVTKLGGTTIAGGTNGSLVKIALTNASGAAGLANGESLRITPSTATADIYKINGTDPSYTPASGGYVDLTHDKFVGGVAYLNLTDSAAGTTTFTLAGQGTDVASLTGTFTVSYKTTDTSFTGSTVIGSTASVTYGTDGIAGSATTATIPVAAKTITYLTTGTAIADLADASYVGATVTDSNGRVSGSASQSFTGLAYDVAYLMTANTAGTKTTGTFSVTLSPTSTSQGFNATTIGGTALVSGVTTAAVVTSSSSISVSPSAVTMQTGGKLTYAVTLLDQFGRAYPNASVKMTGGTRNAIGIAPSATTNADGVATFTLTDAPTTTTSVLYTDSFTFTAYGIDGTNVASSAATISWSTVAIAAGTVTILGGNNGTTTGVADATPNYKDISAGDGAEAGAVTATATVKDAGGNLLAGVPVTFTVSGTGAAVTSTTATVYTGAAGTATANVYAWVAGSYTVTATAGGKSGTAVYQFRQSGAGEERVISASVEGSVVTAKVVDRFGNPVPAVTVYATKSGAGYFGNGTLKTSTTTDNNGEAQFVVTGGAADVTVSTLAWDAAAGTNSSGQTCASKGNVNCVVGTTAATAFTAYTAGTATKNEEGVGASYDAAGVSSATVSVTVSGSSDSVDAANEATDAANAATDAANAAAEAADAATAAAQDAQAAVAELATKVASLIAGIKAQITTLTNLVIKIQKKVRA